MKTRARMRWFGTALVSAILLGPAASLASAAEIWEILSFKQQGISDDVIIALIESDGSVFHLTAADVQMLHNKGLSDPVILAMLKTAKKRPDVPPAQPGPLPGLPLTTTPPPDVASAPPPGAEPTTAPPQDQQDMTQASPDVAPPPQVVEVQVPVEVPVEVPVYVPVAVPVVISGVLAPASHAPVNHPVAQAVTPQYWGFGGQRRPDTWQEPTTGKAGGATSSNSPGGSKKPGGS